MLSPVCLFVCVCVLLPLILGLTCRVPFASLVFLDHVLYPTLTTEGFVTEVHHVTGDGDDQGVVYCEMQGRENLDWSRSFLAYVSGGLWGGRNSDRPPSLVICFSVEGGVSFVLWCYETHSSGGRLIYDCMGGSAQRALFPEGCGYRYETGGIMKNLRSLTAETGI